MVYNIYIFLKCNVNFSTFLILCLYLFYMNSFKSVFCPRLQPPCCCNMRLGFFQTSIQMIQMILDEVKNWERARPNNLAVLTPLGTSVSAGEKKKLSADGKKSSDVSLK